MKEEPRRDIGEGNKEADRRYRKDAEEFAGSERERRAADEARKAVEKNPEELERAEKAGKKGGKTSR